jgi:hypothetical protein
MISDAAILDSIDSIADQLRESTAKLVAQNERLSRELVTTRERLLELERRYQELLLACGQD